MTPVFVGELLTYDPSKCGAVIDELHKIVGAVIIVWPQYVHGSYNCMTPIYSEKLLIYNPSKCGAVIDVLQQYGRGSY